MAEDNGPVTIQVPVLQIEKWMEKLVDADQGDVPYNEDHLIMANEVIRRHKAIIAEIIAEMAMFA